MTQPNQDRRNWLSNPSGYKYAFDSIAGGRNTPYSGMPYRVTSTSSRFGTKIQQSPQIWDQFKSLEDGKELKKVNPHWHPKDGTLTTYTYAGDGRVVGGKAVRSRPSVDGQFATNYRKFTPSKTVRLSYWIKLQNYRVGSDTGVFKLTRMCSTNSAGGGQVLRLFTISTLNIGDTYSITFGGVTHSIVAETANAQSIALQLSAKMQTDLPGWWCYVSNNRLALDIPLAQWKQYLTITCSANMTYYSSGSNTNGGYYNGYGSHSFGGTGDFTGGFITVEDSYICNITGGSGTTYNYTTQDGSIISNNYILGWEGYVIEGKGSGQKFTFSSSGTVNNGTTLFLQSAPAISLDNTSVVLIRLEVSKYATHGQTQDVWQQVIQDFYVDTNCTRTGFNYFYLDGELLTSLTNKRNCHVGKPYLLNSVLLGTMVANLRFFYKPTTFTANLTYSIIISSVTYSWTAGSTVPTVQDIVLGLYGDYYNKNKAAVDGGSLVLLKDDGNLGLGVHYANPVTWSVGDWVIADRVPAILITDVFVDVGVGNDRYVTGFFVGEASSWSACKIREPQIYYKWLPNDVRFDVYAPTIAGTKYLYYSDETGNVELLGPLSATGLTATT